LRAHLAGQLGRRIWVVSRGNGSQKGGMPSRRDRRVENFKGKPNSTVTEGGYLLSVDHNVNGFGKFCRIGKND